MIPEDWTVVPFQQLLDFRNGINADRRAYGKGVAFINVFEIISKGHLKVQDIPGRVSIDKKSIESYLVRQGDIVFNRSSETQDEVGLSSVYLDDTPAVFGGFVIRGQCKQALDPIYSGYAFRAPAIRTQIVARGQGAIRANIGQSDLKQIHAPLPSLDEQRAIAEALSDADALIESLDQLIAKKFQIKQGVMQELLTSKRRLPGFSGKWELKRLGDLGSTYGGLTGKTKADFGEGSSHYITFMNIMANVVIDCDIFEPVNISSTESQNRAVKGDLFFNGSSETPEEVGLCSVLADSVADVYLNSFCFGFRFRDGAKADGLYFAYYFRSLEGRELLKSLAQGATRYNLSKTALLKVAFPLPSLEEQIAIATVLSDMDTELVALDSRLAKARRIKQGMMQELLTGRIRLL